MREISRRGFFKLATAVTLGALTEPAAGTVALTAADTVKGITKKNTYNASVVAESEEHCKDDLNPTECIQNYEVPEDQRISAAFIDPVLTECTFRLLPSELVSGMEKGGIDGVVEDALFGTRKLETLRRELLVGFLSSLAYGYAHNFTRRGFDLNTIPVYNTINGFYYWILQRKLGMFANITSHIVHNSRIVFKYP